MPSARPWALVTGGARRLGAAFAVDLAARGWNVWIHYHRSEDDARRLAEQLSPRVETRLVQADLSVSGGAESLAAALEAAPPTTIVHSASRWGRDTALDAQADDWEAQHRVHVWSALVLGRFLAAHGGGHLVTLLDARLRDRDPGHFSYAFSKRELAQLTRYLAAELAPGVRVNGIAPGLVLRAEELAEDAWARMGAEHTPLGRVGSPDDVVAALRYLDNTFVTGQLLAVDGGRHLKGDLFGSL